MNADGVEMLWLYVGEKWSNFVLPNDDDLLGVKMQVWLDELGDLDVRAVKAAFVALGDSQFCPPLGKVRETALRMECAANGVELPPDLDQAWGEVMKAIARVGRYGKPEWSHPAVANTVDAIGWKEICGSENMGVLRGQFAKLYDTCKGRSERQILRPAPALAPFVAGVLQRADDLVLTPVVREIGASEQPIIGHESR